MFHKTLSRTMKLLPLISLFILGEIIIFQVFNYIHANKKEASCPPCQANSNATDFQKSKDTFKKGQPVNNTTKRYKRRQNSRGYKKKGKKSKFDISWIDSHPVFSKFQIATVAKRKRVTVVIVVSTAPMRHKRREVIRKSWLKDCKNTNNVVVDCFFMTDHQNPNSSHYKEVMKELKLFGDMRFQNLKGGVEFGKRFLYQTIYAFKNYKFDYFVRMDDDQFFCANRFLQMIPLPVVPMLHYGWVHPGLYNVRPEEFLILLSRDLLELFFTKQDPKKIKCSPFTDQMIAQWVTEMNLTGKIFRHTSNIHHHPPVNDMPHLRLVENVCTSFTTIHGCYASDMMDFWDRRGPYVKVNITLLDDSKPVRNKENFNWKMFPDYWQYEPKPCIDNPIWDTSNHAQIGQPYIGREG